MKVLRNIFAGFMAFVSLSSAIFASDDIDLYYVNGIMNTRTEAKNSMKILRDKLRYENIYDDDAFDQNHTYLQYNISRNLVEDMLETYYQLRESGQIDGEDIGFFAFLIGAFGGGPEAATAFAAAASSPSDHQIGLRDQSRHPGRMT
jgi:capsule polysaccharide export protein KpsE/RkpR